MPGWWCWWRTCRARPAVVRCRRRGGATLPLRLEAPGFLAGGLLAAMRRSAVVSVGVRDCRLDSLTIVSLKFTKAGRASIGRRGRMSPARRHDGRVLMVEWGEHTSRDRSGGVRAKLHRVSGAGG